MTKTSKINISIDPNSLRQLKNNKFILTVFRGIQSSDQGFVPLVMSIYDDYLSNNQIVINDNKLGGYISTEKIKPGVKITATVPQQTRNGIASSNSINIESGQKMIIDKVGNLSLKNSGGANLKIVNNNQNTFTTGFGNINDDNSKFQLFCAGNIFNGNLLKVIPSDAFLVVFTTDRSFQPGVYKKKLSDTGFLIHTLKGVERNVSFSQTKGWSANNEVWAKRIHQGSSLASILIKNMSGIGER